MTPAAALFACTPTPALSDVFVFSARMAGDVESVDDSTGSFLNVGMTKPSLAAATEPLFSRSE
jgi:hypothetical protein